MADIHLYDYWRSSAAYRLRIGLNLLGLPYDRTAVDLAVEEQRDPAYLARNPQGLVPTLDIDGQSLTQSLAILEYLNETRTAGWLPDEPLARAKARALAHAIAVDIHPVCNLRVARHATRLGATMEGWMQHFITLGFEGVEGLMPAELPSTVTLFDICLVPQVYNARRWAVDLTTFPHITARTQFLEQLPAFRDAHPDRARP